MEEQISQEPQYTTKHAVLLALEDYNVLNEVIGTAKHYPDLISDTDCYSEPNPAPNWDGKYYMQITAEVQEKYPETLEGIELIDEIPVEVIEP
jgi:hypothetical protein